MPAPFLCKVFNTREEWLEARKGSLGGSEVAAVLGHGRYGALAVQARHLGELEPEPPRLRLKCALAIEGPASDDAAEKLQAAVVDAGNGRIAMYLSTEIPHAHATPDRFVFRQKPKRVHAQRVPLGAIAVLSLKNWSGHAKHEWIPLPPIDALLQLQWEMLLTGVQKGFIHTTFDAGNDAIVSPEIEPHLKVQERLRNEIPAWWERHIVQRVPVPAGADDLETLKKLYPVPNPRSYIELHGPEWLAVRAKFSELEEQKTILKQKSDELEALAKQALGDHEYGVLDDGSSIAWKRIEKQPEKKPRGAVSYRQFFPNTTTPKDIAAEINQRTKGIPHE